MLNTNTTHTNTQNTQEHMYKTGSHLKPKGMDYNKSINQSVKKIDYVIDSTIKYYKKYYSKL